MTPDKFRDEWTNVTFPTAGGLNKGQKSEGARENITHERAQPKTTQLIEAEPRNLLSNKCIHQKGRDTTMKDL